MRVIVIREPFGEIPDKVILRNDKDVEDQIREHYNNVTFDTQVGEMFRIDLGANSFAEYLYDVMEVTN